MINIVFILLSISLPSAVDNLIKSFAYNHKKFNTGEFISMKQARIECRIQSLYATFSII